MRNWITLNETRYGGVVTINTEHIVRFYPDENGHTRIIFPGQLDIVVVKESPAQVMKLIRQSNERADPEMSCETCRHTQDYSKPPCNLCNTYSRWQEKTP